MVPNLDALDRDDVVAFARSWRGASSDVAAVLFPSRPPGYVRVVSNLVQYADAKALAMLSRQAGNVDDALKLEGICDAIYRTLPAYARW